MAKELARMADRIANRYRSIAAELYQPRRQVDWDRLRDIVDLDTEQALDAIQLDILTDLVELRLRAAI